MKFYVLLISSLIVSYCFLSQIASTMYEYIIIIIIIEATSMVGSSTSFINKHIYLF